MIKFYFTSIFILFFSFGFSQNYPDLNASTGNENEFPVDKDTNIYMFHGNRLAKTDKNFNVIWANNYSGITFSHLLLSKTGSMYFLGKNSGNGSVFGKLMANGNLAWVKNAQNTVITGTTTAGSLECRSFILDRNNHIVISGGSSSGNGYIFKTDTNGADIKLSSFSQSFGCMTGLTILEDSAGYYKLFGIGAIGFGGYSFGLHTFSDASNSIVSAKLGGINNMYNVRWRVIRSRFSGNYYVSASGDIVPSTPFDVVVKFNTRTGNKWGRSVISIGPGDITNLNESPSGDLICSAGYTSAVTAFPIDSNGVVGSNAMYLTNNLYNINAGPPQVIYNNNYYFYLTGPYFSLNPLTVQKFNSSYTFSCALTAGTSSNPGGFVFFSASTPTTDPVISYTVPFYSSIVTAVTFTISQNYCQALGLDEMKIKDASIAIFPNPANEKIYFDDEVRQIEMFDVNGKNLKNAVNVSQLNISDLPNGIYFMRIKTDKGEFNKKFVKE